MNARTEGHGDTTERVKAVDFLTVVYKREVLLLKLQARSFASFMDPSGVGTLMIVVNDPDPAGTRALLEEHVMPEYGAFRKSVVVIDATDLPDTQYPVNGWRRQQSVKLLAAQQLTREHYIALDAKNHFIKPCSVGDFILPDGRMRTFRTQQKGSLQPYFRNVAEYFGVDPEPYVEQSMPATTPYVLSRPLVVALIDEIERREGESFADFFHKPKRHITEFFLYFFYLLSLDRPLEQIYRFGPRNTVTLFTRWPNTEEQLREALDKIDQPPILMFGLHSNRAVSIDDHFARIVRDMWVRVGLFADDREALTYFNDLRRSIDDEAKPLVAS